jgi:hypothetical protein
MRGHRERSGSRPVIRCAEMRRIGVTPHVAQNTARFGGSAKSINARRGMEKVFACK